jgi:NAD(P)-dependent dehydrogenase (short-subunit alcohol dehydrogenase family)
MRLVITGVNRGIGEGLARAALNAGHSVVGMGRQRPSWPEYEAFTFVECDMADHERLAEAGAAIDGAIDAVICSAATFANRAWTGDSFDTAALAEAFAVNTIAPMIIAKTLKPQLEAGSRRLIVMMSTGNASLSGNTAGTMLGYRLSKSALNQAVRNLAAEWGPEGFTIAALNPGWVKTDMGGPDAEISVEEASRQILAFVEEVSTRPQVNGAFVNTDGSQLPW